MRQQVERPKRRRFSTGKKCFAQTRLVFHGRVANIRCLGQFSLWGHVHRDKPCPFLLDVSFKLREEILRDDHLGTLLSQCDQLGSLLIRALFLDDGLCDLLSKHEVVNQIGRLHDVESLLGTKQAGWPDPFYPSIFDPTLQKSSDVIFEVIGNENQHYGIARLNQFFAVGLEKSELCHGSRSVEAKVHNMIMRHQPTHNVREYLSLSHSPSPCNRITEDKDIAVGLFLWILVFLLAKPILIVGDHHIEIVSAKSPCEIGFAAVPHERMRFVKSAERIDINGRIASKT